MLNGIFWRFRTGLPWAWADIPERYGPHTTCYNRFVRWREASIWDRLLSAMSEAVDGEIVMIGAKSSRRAASRTSGADPRTVFSIAQSSAIGRKASSTIGEPSFSRRFTKRRRACVQPHGIEQETSFNGPSDRSTSVSLS